MMADCISAYLYAIIMAEIDEWMSLMFGVEEMMRAVLHVILLLYVLPSVLFSFTMSCWDDSISARCHELMKWLWVKKPSWKRIQCPLCWMILQLVIQQCEWYSCGKGELLPLSMLDFLGDDIVNHPSCDVSATLCILCDQSSKDFPPSLLYSLALLWWAVPCLWCSHSQWWCQICLLWRLAWVNARLHQLIIALTIFSHA